MSRQNRASNSIMVPVEVSGQHWNRKKRRVEASKLRRGLARPTFVKTNRCPCTSSTCEICNARSLNTMINALEKHWSDEKTFS